MPPAADSAMRFSAPLLTFAGLISLAAPRPAVTDPVSSRIYPAPPLLPDRAALPANATIIEVRTHDGLTLRGIAVPPRDNRAVLLALPGNASTAADAIGWTSALRDLGYGVVAVGYRGYSGNPGQPSAEGLAMDADAFLADLRVRFPGRRVWVVGHSLGGAVGLDLAARLPIDGLVTWGAFRTLRDMAPGFGRYLVPDDFRNVERLVALKSFWLLGVCAAEG